MRLIIIRDCENKGINRGEVFENTPHVTGPKVPKHGMVMCEYV